MTCQSPAGRPPTWPRRAQPTQQYTFTVTPTSDGTITVTIPAGRVTDPASNSITASNALQITFDRTTPGPTLSTDADSPTNAASVTVTVDFGKPVDPDTFTLGDVSATGGTASDLAHSSANQTFTFTLTTGTDGEVTAEIPADRVMDIADNNNTASNMLRVTFDRTTHVPALSTDAVSPTNAASATVTVDFGEPVDPDTFTLDDVSVSGGTASDLAQKGATTQQYTFTVTPTSDGTITVTIPAGRVTDPASNSITASNALQITFDRTTPGPTLPTGTYGVIWTVEDLVGMLGSEGRHNFEMIARCDDGTVLTGATLKLHLGGLLTQIGANALETVDVPYKLVIDVERSWWDYPEYWSLASIITDTATAKIADTLIDYGITLDEYIDAGPDAVFEYPKYNATKEYLGGLDAYEVNIDWSGEGTCTVEWIRY